MKKEFRVSIRLRWLVNLLVISFTAHSLFFVYNYIFHSPPMLSTGTLSFFIACNFIIIICSIGLSKLKYIINDEELVIIQILERDKCYKLSKIRKIKKIPGFISYTKVYFREKAMPVNCLVDKRDGFAKILQRKSAKSKL